MTTAPFQTPIAHRGLHDRTRGIIENSASAFEAAIAGGYGIECDVQLTADGEAMVFHDDDLQRLTGQSGSIRETTAATFGRYPLTESSAGDTPQTLGGFLDQMAGRTPLVVEIKHQPDRTATETLAKRVAAVIAGYKGEAVVKSFDPKMLIALRKAGYRGRLGIITYRYDRPEWYGDMPARTRFVLRHLLHYPISRFAFISCEQSALTLPAVRLLRALGMKVISWTIKSQAQADAAFVHADQIVFEGFIPDAD